MELNREQIIKALGCCHSHSYKNCPKCPYNEDTEKACFMRLMEDALSLIKELTEDNKSLTETVKVRGETIEKLQIFVTDISEDNRKLTEAGDIIRLPLKVGDIVYSYTHFWRKEDGISPYQITNITITQNKKGIWTKKYRAMRMLSGKTIDDQLNFAFDEIGGTVFLTLIDADRALKGE